MNTFRLKTKSHLPSPLFSNIVKLIAVCLRTDCMTAGLIRGAPITESMLVFGMFLSNKDSYCWSWGFLKSGAWVIIFQYTSKRKTWHPISVKIPTVYSIQSKVSAVFHSVSFKVIKRYVMDGESVETVLTQCWKESMGTRSDLWPIQGTERPLFMGYSAHKI